MKEQIKNFIDKVVQNVRLEMTDDYGDIRNNLKLVICVGGVKLTIGK